MTRIEQLNELNDEQLAADIAQSLDFALDIAELREFQLDTNDDTTIILQLNERRVTITITVDRT